ncbi:MAG: FKBP-type peptidyl-prolyl cis-trans isomerase [Bacteroidales bacterium]|nr:FKBP-type peptidyl-prolyl cis-trans isomerase [Bacteroidales bacterium]
MTASKKINSKIIAFVLLGLLIGLNACKKDYIDYAKLQQEEIDARDKYLNDSNITVEPTASGLYYIEILEGSGDKPTYGRIVEVGYTGRLLDGTIFDADTIEFAYGTGSVISGWHEGVSYMKVGGKAKLIIPSSLAYGQYEQGIIPRYSTLVFDMELINAQ